MSQSLIFKRIEQQLKQNSVLLYMKGSPRDPRCGFSAKVVDILKKLRVQYAYVDILNDLEIRAELPKYAAWPTFPQLYIQAELIGGCDIITELYADQTLAARMQAIGACHDQALPYLAANILIDE